MTFTEFFDHPEKRTMDEVIAFFKANPELFDKHPMGREILKCIKQGNIRRLRRFWVGAK